MRKTNFFYKLIIGLIGILFINGCSRVNFAQFEGTVDPDIQFVHDSILIDDTLEMRYLIVDGKDKDGLIFYFHGIFRTEYEWVEENGFGSRYYSVLDSNNCYKDYPVVSISFGDAYLMINDAPDPFNADIESVFKEKVVEYFRQRLNITTDKLYLIGHSMGGFNALMLSMRDPEMFPVSAVISPYTAPVSPWSDEFDIIGKRYNLGLVNVFLLRQMLTGAFKNVEKWNQYNPFVLATNNDKLPYLIISVANDDLPGFNWAVSSFSEHLREQSIDHYFCDIEGDHWQTCNELFVRFLGKISEID